MTATTSSDSQHAPAEVLVYGKRIDKLPEDLYIPPDALEVFLETFQGPLDLLLYLIRRQNIDILDIPVALITRQYMEYVELMRRFRLDLAAEYLVMAAWLAEIKSRMLLPRPPADDEEEDEDPRAALVRRLQEYERFTRAAQELETQPRLERDLYLVGADFAHLQTAPVEAVASINDLVSAFRAVLDRTRQYRHWVINWEALSVREKMSAVLARIRRRRFIRFEDLLEKSEGRAGLVVNFIAVLELMRDRMLEVVQNKPFAPIHLRGIEGGEDDGK